MPTERQRAASFFKKKRWGRENSEALAVLKLRLKGQQL